MALLIGFGFSGALTVTGISTNASPRLLPIYSVDSDQKRVAITFDAAWSAEDTDALLSILNKHDAKITLFAVGDWVRANPDAVKKFYDNGHEIGNHSDTHALFAKVSKEKVTKEIGNCNNEIEKLIGTKPKLVRAPSGDYDNKSIKIAESYGMKMIQWDVDIIDIKVMTNVYLYAIMSIVLV